MTEIASHDGHRWIRLATREEIAEENRVMALDVGHDDWNVDYLSDEPDNDGIWSLRDADGKRVLTVQVRQSWDESWDCEESWAFVDGIDMDTVQGSCGRNPSSSENLHVATLRAWFAEQGRTFCTQEFFSDDELTKEEWQRRGPIAVRVLSYVSRSETGQTKTEIREEPQPVRFVTVDKDLPDPSRLSDGSVALRKASGALFLFYVVDGEWKRFALPDHAVEIGVENTLIRCSGGKVFSFDTHPGHMTDFGGEYPFRGRVSIFTGFLYPQAVIRRPPLPQPETQWKPLVPC